MAIDEITGGSTEIDRFPIGMRVLAVDDDPTCLTVLDRLLRKCQYQVATTNKAITALNMLRENKNRFDLVISDVYMPDMDGFKLLELVGLEMDLPVIMLSGNSDMNLVMKGITHGACDYLVKPVRLEEIRNIWQHVIRRKVDKKSKFNDHPKRPEQENGGGDQIEMMNRKRKDGDGDEENGNESDDLTTKKKPRVVWSVDLHRKFVAAINRLGYEKAVPKRILTLMNVDGLTREKVASHLQKYRGYLKKMMDEANKANMVVAFGGNNEASSYMRMSSLDVQENLRTLSSSRRLPNAIVPPDGLVGRLNSPIGVALHSLTAPPPIPTNYTQTRLQQVAFSNHQNLNSFQGILTSSDLDQLPYSKNLNTQLTNFDPVEESRIFTGTNLAYFSSVDDSEIFTDPIGVPAKQADLNLTPTRSESLNLLDHNGIQLSNFCSNQLSVGERYTYPTTISGAFSSNTVTTTDVPIEAHGGDLVGDTVQNVNRSFSNQNSGPYSTQDYSGYSQNVFKAPATSTLAASSVPMSHSRPHVDGSTLVPTDQTNLLCAFGSLDDVITGMMLQDTTMLVNEEFGDDPYMVSGRRYADEPR